MSQTQIIANMSSDNQHENLKSKNLSKFHNNTSSNYISALSASDKPMQKYYHRYSFIAEPVYSESAGTGISDQANRRQMIL